MEPYQELEVKWAEANGLDPRGMVACSSGTSALHLALEALRLPPGSEVITGDFSMIAVPRAIAMAGLTPVFVDCGEDLNIDMESALDYAGKNLRRARALIAVHVYGRRCRMDLFDGLAPDAATEVEGRLIEDLAEAHGVKPHSRTDAACWSHYRNKQVAGEEGGTVWFRDPKHADLARQLRSLGFTADHDYNHVPRGHNYRMSNLHAGHILSGYGELNRNGLPSFAVNTEMRREIESWYDEFCPEEWRMPPRDAVWVYDVRIPYLTVEGQRRIVKALQAEGIAARFGFKPMSNQREFSGCRMVKGGVRHKPEKGGFKCEKGVDLVCLPEVNPSHYTNETRASVASREVFYLPVQPGVTSRKACQRAFDVIQPLLGVVSPSQGRVSGPIGGGGR